MGPDFWAALVTESIKAAAVVVAALITVGIPAWRKLRRVDAQVSNDHGTNLRDDVDRAVDAATRAGAVATRAAETSDENREWIGSLALEVRRLSNTLERRRRWPWSTAR